MPQQIESLRRWASRFCRDFYGCTLRLELVRTDPQKKNKGLAGFGGNGKMGLNHQQPGLSRCRGVGSVLLIHLDGLLGLEYVQPVNIHLVAQPSNRPSLT